MALAIVRCAAVVAASFALVTCAAHTTFTPAETTDASSASTSNAARDVASAALTDDWITLGHDYARTGLQRQAIGVTPATAGKLTLRWKRALQLYPYAGVLAYGGNVIVTTFGAGSNVAMLFDLRASDGATIWKRQIAGSVSATPSIDPATKTLIVSTQSYGPTGLPIPAPLYAISLLDGSVQWQVMHAGLSHSSPAIVNGIIYLGTSGGDREFGCQSGGVGAYRSSDGAQLWQWHEDPHPSEGGAVWGAIAFDGEHLIFGTANTCEGPITTANGAVALGLDGHIAWSFVAHQSSTWDDDTGAGVDVTDGRAIFINKNGTLYNLAAASGALQWKQPLGAADESGGFSTASTDGTTIVDGAGYFGTTSASVRCGPIRRSMRRAHLATAGIYSYVKGVDATTGRVLWSRKTSDALVGQAGMVDGVAFAGINDDFEAIDARSGQTLWSYPGSAVFDASPAVVPSGIYTADANGNIYAFSLPRHAGESGQGYAGLR
jgi:hypothetical protein